MYNEGISKTGEILDLAVKIGIVENLNFCCYDGERIGRGRESKKIYLKSPETALEIESKIRSEKDEKDEKVQEDNGSDCDDTTDNLKGNKEINVD